MRSLGDDRHPVQQVIDRFCIRGCLIRATHVQTFLDGLLGST